MGHVIEEVLEADFGRYYCLIKNVMGETECTAYLSIKSRASISSPSSLSTIIIFFMPISFMFSAQNLFLLHYCSFFCPLLRSSIKPILKCNFKICNIGSITKVQSFRDEWISIFCFLSSFVEVSLLILKVLFLSFSILEISFVPIFEVLFLVFFHFISSISPDYGTMVHNIKVIFPI